MAIVLKSKPGLSGATTLSIPKDWDPAWFRGLISNQLKGADVRNAVGANGISVTGTIASPYATISLGAGPIVIPAGPAGTNTVTINGASGANALIVNGSASFVGSGGISVTGPAATQDNFFTFGQTGQSTWQIYAPASSNDIQLFNNGYGNVVTFHGSGGVGIGAVSAASSTLQIGSSGNYGWAGGSNLGSIDIGLAGSILGYSDGQVALVSNGYFDGATWRYKRASQSALYFSLTAGGDFQWLSGGSGAAGGAFTFTTRMVLLQSGSAGFGTNYCAAPDAFWGAYKGVIGSTAGIRIGYSTTQDNYYDADNHFFRTTAAGALMTISGSTGISVTVTSSTTAPAAGGAGALPATPTGYMQLTINGTVRRIPYYT